MKLKNLKFVLPVIAGISLVGGTFTNINSQVFAVGSGDIECSGASLKGYEVGSQNSMTYSDSTGKIINGVCIKSGSNMFGGNKHSGILSNGSFENGCYTVAGVETSSVSVVRNYDGNSCQGLSHIDIFLGNASPSPSPSVLPSPTSSVSPSPNPSPSPSPSVSPSPNPSPSIVPSPSPTPSVVPSPSPTPVVSPSPSPSPSVSPIPSPTPVASPSPLPSPTDGGQTQTQNQEQKNEQIVNVSVLGVKTPTVQPETGAGVLGFATVASFAPIGFALSRFRVKRNTEEESINSLVGQLLNDRENKKNFS